jgi:hypothetical protein
MNEFTEASVRLTYRDYYKEMRVQPYHGMEHLDSWKHMSENLNLPEAIRDFAHAQYTYSLVTLETSPVRDFSNLLYKRLNGNENPVFGPVIASTDIYNIKLVAREIDIPYFSRVKEYFGNLGMTVPRVDTRYTVFDVLTLNGDSLLADYINYSVAKNSSPSSIGAGYSKEIPWVINEWQYSILNHFVSPYNGVGAHAIPKICEEAGKDSRGYSSCSPMQKKADYFNHVIIKGMDYHVPAEIREKYRIMSEKELQEFLNANW